MSSSMFQARGVNFKNFSHHKIALENCLKISEDKLKVHCATGTFDIPIQWIQSFSPFIRKLLVGSKETLSFSTSKADPVALVLPHVKVETVQNLVEILVYGQFRAFGNYEIVKYELEDLIRVLQIPIERLLIDSSNKKLRIMDLDEVLNTSEFDLPSFIPILSDQNLRHYVNSRSVDHCDSEGNVIMINDSIDMECQYCDMHISTLTQAKDHIKRSKIANFCYDGESHTDLSCPFNGCNSKFDSPIYLYRHQAVQHNYNESPFKCKTCEGIDATQVRPHDEENPYSLRNHERSQHQQEIHFVFETNFDNELKFSYKIKESLD